MSAIQNCPLCHTPLRSPSNRTERDTHIIRCATCGKFEITEECFLFTDVKQKLDDNAHLLSGLIREMNDSGEEPPMIKTDNVDQLLDDPRVPQPDDIQRKAEKILKDIKRRTAFFGELIPIDLEHEHSAFFAKNRQEFQSLLTMLLEQHLLSKDSSIDAYRVIAPSADSNQVWLLSLTGKAFERFSLGVFGSKVFIACRFTPDHQACIDAMCTGVRGAHFEPMCLINEVFSERIMDKALAEIAESRYVVVDLTGGRLSVALETGYALALEKEIIFVAHESERENREFYSGHYRISYYRDERQLAEIVMNAILIRSKLKDRLA